MDAIEQLMSPQTEQARACPVLGVVTARVRRIDDDGAYRLEYLSMGDSQLSAPARVMMPMAGAQRGIYCLPEVGDEVVVAFELGDTNLPVIIGAVWNNDSPPPGQAKPSPENNIRTVVSRSGHELTFDDTPGAERIRLKSQGGHSLTLDDNPKTRTVTLQTGGGHRLVLNDSLGAVSLSSESGFQIEFSDTAGTLLISAPVSITLQSSTITLQANALNISAVPAMVLIGNSSFGLHVHAAPPPAPPAPFTGPVLP